MSQIFDVTGKCEFELIILAQFDVFVNFIESVLIDDRAERDSGIFGGTDFETLGGFGKSLDELLVNLFEDDHSGTGGTFLPRVTEGRMDDPLHGFIEIGVVINDDCIFAAHFGDHVFDRSLSVIGMSGGLIDVETNGHRASKRDDIDIGTAHEFGADIFPHSG